MQKTLPILGLFAILFVGMLSPAMAQYDEWDEKYKQLHEEFEEKRHAIERQFQEEFQELDRYYEQQKMEIYEKIENNPDLSDSEINAMFDGLFSEFDEKRQSLESDMMRQFQELEEMFEEEFRHLDDKYRDEHVNADGTYRDTTEYEDDGEFYENDPEWQSIEPMAKRIMEMIPPEKIQRLWEAGEIEQLVELIVSETDLSYEQAKRVVVFFEKYDNRDDASYDNSEYYQEHDYNKYDYPEHDYPEHDYVEPYPEPYPVPTVDSEQVLRLEQRISELEVENQMLRETIGELEEKITQINAVLMEQVKFIYEWVSTQ
ncbi:OmpH/Skp family outer membrane protein [Nitrosopumilus sp. S6]